MAVTATLRRPTLRHWRRDCDSAFKFILLCSSLSCIAAQTATPSPSALCASGWSYYSDSNGSEGQASCLKVTGSSTYNWWNAMISCPRNSHLLTMAGASVNTGLHAFSRTLTSSGSSFWVGASQSSTATSVNRGWAWIDGTSASASLNCGAPGDQGCGLWPGDQPGYAHYRRAS